ncbi:MAG: hypothetical protein WCO35_02625 [Candidatus Nomurabacteria bacterium]
MKLVHRIFKYKNWNIISYIVLGLIISFLLFLLIYSQDKLSKKEIFELQQKCSEQGTKFIKYNESQKGEDNTDKETNIVTNFDIKSNNCYIYFELESADVSDRFDNIVNGSKYAYLYNATSYKEIGQITYDGKYPEYTSCKVEEKDCKTPIEFNNLVKSYLNN